MRRTQKTFIIQYCLLFVPVAIGALAFFEKAKGIFSWGWKAVAIIIGLLCLVILLVETLVIFVALGWYVSELLASKSFSAQGKRRKSAALILASAVLGVLCFWAPHLPAAPIQPSHPKGSPCNTLAVLADFHGRCRLASVDDPDQTQRTILQAAGTLSLSFAFGAMLAIFNSSSHKASTDPVLKDAPFVQSIRHD